MLFGASACDISSNARVLEYPYADAMLQVCNTPIFRAAGWECRQRPYTVPPKGQAADPERAAVSSRCRAKREVRDIAMCNRFSHFLTWTLNGAVIDRYGTDTVRKAVLTWLKNASHRKGFRYLIIAERHKDGAIHFHGLCNPGLVRLERATHPRTGAALSTDRGQPIFNMPEWRYGFSTCIPIDEHYERTCQYLTKYFEKDFTKIFGKWYFASRDLIRKPQISLIDGGIPFDEFVADHPEAYVVPVFGDVKIAGMSLPSPEKGGTP